MVDLTNSAPDISSDSSLDDTNMHSIIDFMKHKSAVEQTKTRNMEDQMLKLIEDRDKLQQQIMSGQETCEKLEKELNKKENQKPLAQVDAAANISKFQYGEELKIDYRQVIQDNQGKMSGEDLQMVNNFYQKIDQENQSLLSRQCQVIEF